MRSFALKLALDFNKFYMNRWIATSFHWIRLVSQHSIGFHAFQKISWDFATVRVLHMSEQENDGLCEAAITDDDKGSWALREKIIVHHRTFGFEAAYA